MSSRNHFIAVLALLLVAVAARPGWAESSNAQEVKARALFAEGRYADALGIYVKLYSETTHPTYLRNIGRCYQNLEQPDKAISSFHEYLRQAKNLAPGQREQIEGYIREMEELKRKRETADAPVRPPQPRAAASASSSSSDAIEDGSAAPARTAKRTAKRTSAGADLSTGGAAPDADHPQEGAGLRRAAMVVGGLGVVGLGIGGWFALDARSKWSDATRQCSTSMGCTSAAQQSGRDADHAAQLATISLAAGGVLLGGGVVLWLLSRGSSSEGSSGERTTAHLQLIPQFGGGLAGGTLAGRF